MKKTKISKNLFFVPLLIWMFHAKCSQCFLIQTQKRYAAKGIGYHEKCHSVLLRAIYTRESPPAAPPSNNGNTRANTPRHRAVKQPVRRSTSPSNLAAVPSSDSPQNIMPASSLDTDETSVHQTTNYSTGQTWIRMGLGVSLDHSPALVLNANYQPITYMPLSLWNWQDAIRAVLSEKADIVAEYEQLVIRSVSFTMKLPSVIVLKNYFRHQDFIPFVTQKYIFLRDDYCCQYCGKKFRSQELSIDHVVPRKEGGKSTWDNVVTACCPCNHKKGCIPVQDLHKIGMKLRRKPRIPSMVELQQKCRQYRRPFLHDPDQNDDDDEAPEGMEFSDSDNSGITNYPKDNWYSETRIPPTNRKFRYHPDWLPYL